MPLTLVAGILAAGCGGATTRTVSAALVRGPALARWTPYIHVNSPIDVVGPRRDNAMVVAANGRLWLLSLRGSLRAFAPAYHSNPGLEAYIALASVFRRGPSCFANDSVYAISFGKPRGVVAIDTPGRVRTFATISAPGLIDGIAFDDTGSFDFRLLVAVTAGKHTTVDAIDCHGRVSVITTKAHRVEGGMVVAPPTFGRFSGDLIAPDELGGGIWAITPAGRDVLVARSGLPHGSDIGVESEAFVPDNIQAQMLLADRLTPGNRHPGDNVLLGVSFAALRRAGVRAFDLLVATEGGARTDAIRCGERACSVRQVAAGPATAHAEGHIGALPQTPR